MYTFWNKILTLLPAAILSITDPLTAQTNLEPNAGIQFNLTPPGAANLALGGAFIGIAYDATAAFTNPAGLSLLAVPEATLEVRHQTFQHRFTDQGRIAGRAPTGFGLDTVAGLQEGTAEDTVLGASYFAYAHRFDSLAVAFYRHELVNFEANFSTQGAFLEPTITRSPTGIPGGPDGRLASLRSRMDLGITGYGLAAAIEPRERLSIGVALTYYDFSLHSRTDRFVPRLFEPPDFQPANVVNFQLQEGEEGAWGVGVGLLWRTARETLQVGLVARNGPEFSFRARSRRGPAATIEFVEADQRARFRAPHTLGLGIGYLPTDRWRLALDLVHIQYSRLTDGLVDIFRLDRLFPELDPELEQFHIEDGLEIHLGAERKLATRTPIFLRGGIWLDPDHTLYFRGDNEAFRAVFRRQSDEIHATFGAGFTGQRLQVDVGADVSRRITALATTLTFWLP